MSERRREDVLRRVQDAGRIGLGELAASTGVSEMTVRRDLDELTRRGLLRRVRGGAVSLDAPADPAGGAGGAGGALGLSGAPNRGPGGGRTGAALGQAVSGEGGSHSPIGAGGGGPASSSLHRVARVVAEQVRPGGSVLLDAGPGALEVAQHLAAGYLAAGPSGDRGPLTVVVTAVEAALVLVAVPGLRLVVLGGESRPGEPGLLGPMALAALGDLHVDDFVLTPAGLDPATGWWARSPDAAALVRAAMARAARTTALVAPGVLGRRSLVLTAPLLGVDRLVVDAVGADPALGADPADAAVLRAVRDAGVEVLRA